jgi:hypothetical protein
VIESLRSRPVRVARENLSFKMGFALFGLILSSFFLLFSPMPAGAQETNTVRVDNDVSILSSDGKPFLLPIYIRHAPDVDAVHIGLDYDELMLRFADAYTLDDAIGGDPVYVVTEHDRWGHLTLLVPFDPASGLERESLLIQLKFVLSNPTSKFDYGYRSSADLKLNGPGTYFLKAGSEDHVPTEATFDGSVTIYACDALELGSAQISPNGQIFSIPLYVTHVQSEMLPFSMGLDYDEVYLDLVGVKPVSALLQAGMMRYDNKTDAGKAWVECPLVNGEYPQLLRHHLLDLVFQYRPGAGVPPTSVLKLTPNFDSLPGSGGAVGEIREGELYIIGPKFIRGDADGSGQLDLNDAFMILGYVTGMDYEGSKESRCLEAMDVDKDGEIDISDAIQLLNFLYLGGSAPAAPFPEAGQAATDGSDMSCDAGKPVFEPLPMPSGF